MNFSFMPYKWMNISEPMSFCCHWHQRIEILYVVAFYLLWQAWPETNCAKTNGVLMEDTTSSKHKHNWPHPCRSPSPHSQRDHEGNTHVMSNRRLYECFSCRLHDFNFSSVQSSSAAPIYFGLHSENKPSKRPLMADTRAPVWGGYEMWIISCSPGFQPLCAPFSLHVLLDSLLQFHDSLS